MARSYLRDLDCSWVHLDSNSRIGRLARALKKCDNPERHYQLSGPVALFLSYREQRLGALCG